MHQKSYVFACAAVLAITGSSLADAHAPAIGDTSVFITLPPFPGFPEQPIVSGDKLYVCTDAHFGTIGDGPPEVQIFWRADGELLDRVPLENIDITQEHGMSAGAFDIFNRLYVLSVQQGLVRVDFENGHQEVYSPPLPDLPMCSAVPSGTTCSPKVAALPPLANDIAFDWDGSAFITDSFQATIFRVPNGGGAPEIWFQDERLLGPVGGFGVNGLRVSPDGQSVYFNVTTEAATGDGVVYRLAKVPHPTAADLTEFHRWSNDTGNPDDMAFGLSGRLYVSIPYQNQVAILDPSGEEITRFPSSAANASLPVPFDTPSGIDFDDASRSIYITNHAEFTEDTAHMVVFKTFVNDFGLPLVRPIVL
jgi:sugar lactone lactonase YvrE